MISLLNTWTSFSLELLLVEIIMHHFDHHWAPGTMCPIGVIPTFGSQHGRHRMGCPETILVPPEAKNFFAQRWMYILKSTVVPCTFLDRCPTWCFWFHVIFNVTSCPQEVFPQPHYLPFNHFVWLSAYRESMQYLLFVLQWLSPTAVTIQRVACWQGQMECTLSDLNECQEVTAAVS